MHQAQAYFIAGGVPLYHRRFEPQNSVETNLIENFLAPTSPLYREGDFLLREKFQGMPSYFAILSTLAGQRRRHKEITAATGLSAD